ncbi:hypothetical protein PHLCEN_2v8474 [Hermanssonia centrifuga]|uniref:Uncharacterized protein n=1 Tax=Hermanssonia centrifuga TaxID=98765 RepID=A0A2R6NU51_9APHY|nr:hypothetical protein PHLCEN_2v8474 [Hermanssonia centrifuga]
MSAAAVLSPSDCEYSIPTWKRVPSTFDVLFGLRLPYRPPPNAIGAFLWRKRVWVETTFALTMLQPWEKFMLVTIMNTLLTLLVTGLYLYFPTHLSFLFERAKYYLLGLEPSTTITSTTTVAESISKFVSDGWAWGWNETIAGLAKPLGLSTKAVEL